MKNKTALMLGYLCFSTICLVSVSMMRAELAFKTVFIFWFIISVLLLFYVLKLMGVIGKGNADGSGASETATEGEDAQVDPYLRLAKQYGLTQREVEILELVCLGKSNTEIAEALFLSESTVKTHVSHIFRKLGVKNRTEAMCFVMKRM